jgi:hypothetical protein
MLLSWHILCISSSTRLFSSNWFICHINTYNLIRFKYSLWWCCTPSIKNWYFLSHILTWLCSSKWHLFWSHTSSYILLNLLHWLLLLLMNMLLLLYNWLLLHLHWLLNYLHWSLSNSCSSHCGLLLLNIIL